MKNADNKFLPRFITNTGLVINMVFTLFIIACVPPTTSETRNAAKGTKEEMTVDPATTNKTAELPAGVNPSSKDNFSQSDRVYAKEEVTELPLEENIEPQKNIEAVSIVEKTEKPVDVRRGNEVVKEQNIFYDKTNDAYDLLQKANESLAGFPVNRVGEVDWMEALNQKLINPRASLSGNEERPIKDNDIIMKNTKEMPYVRFSHRVHTSWLDCSNCHDRIFLPKINASQINMNKIFGGEYCGVCHNKVAFTTYVCEMCHSEKNTPE